MQVIDIRGGLAKFWVGRADYGANGFTTTGPHRRVQDAERQARQLHDCRRRRQGDRYQDGEPSFGVKFTARLVDHDRFIRWEFNTEDAHLASRLEELGDTALAVWLVQNTQPTPLF